MLTDAEKAHLDEHGFVLLENAITTVQADALRERSMALAVNRNGEAFGRACVSG